MDQNKKSYLALLKKQQKEKDWDAMLVSAQEAVAAHPDDRVFWRKLHFAQSHYVDAKLNSDLVHELDEQHSYKELLQVYQRLLMVFPESKKLSKLMKKARKALSEETLKEQASYLTEAQSKVESLVKEGRVDDALQACYEILTYVPEDKRSIRMTTKVLRQRERQIDKEIGTVFRKSYDLTKIEFKANKKSVIRI